MRINPYVFRAYDIRGIYKKDIDEELFRKIGFVLGKKKEKFVVGNDTRKSGKRLARALIGGLILAGAKAIYTGTTSFGQTLFAGWRLKFNKTLFITASHLTPEWNGLKIYYGDGEPFSEKEIKELRNEVLKLESKKIEPIKVEFEKVNIKNRYFNFLLKKFSEIKDKNLKVIIDCGNGSMSLVAPEIFKKIGFKVKKLYCNPDPDFPNRNPEPTFEATEVLRKNVISEKADFGVAFDGDGDRGVIIDDKGRYLNGNQIGIILGKEILPNSKEKRIIITPTCSVTIEKELKPLKPKIIRVPVGHTYVISGCKKYKACLGIEESSHIVMPEYFLFDDAILIPLKITQIFLKNQKRLSELVNQIEIYPFEEVVFNCPDEKKFEVVKRLTKELKKKYQRVNTLDGVKLSFDFGWILIRASNTSPKIRLYIEAKTKEKLNLLKQKFSKILKEKI